jgi:hypothetical protein
VKRILSLLAVPLVSAAILWALVQVPTTREWFVPQPDTVVQDFVSQFGAKRYDIARQALDDSLRQQVQASDLAELDQALRAKFGDYRFQLDGAQVDEGNHTRYTIPIQTEKQGIQRIAFELERNPDTQLWEISSLADLKRQAQR